MDIAIEPTVKSYDITKLSYQIDALVANKFCKISAFLAESDGNRIKRIVLILEGEEYAQWGNDDEWLLDWIASKCGVQRAKPPVPPPPEPVPEPTVLEPIPEEPAPPAPEA